MHVFLIHGMGRNPLSLLRLGLRLRRGGMRPHYFAYYATFESFDACVARLQKTICRISPTEPYILVGHSLGTVLCRAVLPKLSHPPQACYFLAPPTVACRWAQRLASRRFYRWLTRDMGRKLADAAFMAQLPIPTMPTLVFAGTRGCHWRGWPR
jgi:alpha-beta hydrolase superfamily lysophospholipase